VIEKALRLINAMFKYGPQKYYASLATKGVWNSITSFRRTRVAAREVIDISLCLDLQIAEQYISKVLNITLENLKNMSIYYADILSEWHGTPKVAYQASMVLALICSRSECVQVIINEPFIKKIMIVYKSVPINSLHLSALLHLIAEFLGYSISYNKVF
jgi:hypothetical protein